MERLPVEIIGYILSQLGAARDVVVASMTCRKWLEARQNHLHSLSFNSNDWPINHNLTSGDFENLITRTIFQTKGLRCLSINMYGVVEFSAPLVIAWLMYTRETLRQLYLDGWTTGKINILQECGRGRLEVLSLTNHDISGVAPVYQKFPFLSSLSLSFVSISALNLSLLLSACPKIEKLALVELDIERSYARSTMYLNNSHLKDLYVKSIKLDNFILEADTLEKLHLKDCHVENFCSFKLVGKGTTLKHLMIDNVGLLGLNDVSGESENLEVLNLSDFDMMWWEFRHMITRSSKLRRLGLWGVDFGDVAVDLETISSCCPLLSHLSLWDNRLDRLNGSFRFENIVKLELMLNKEIDEFSLLVQGFVERCPRLKKMVIQTFHEEFPELTSFIDTIIRKYRHVKTELQFLDLVYRLV